MTAKVAESEHALLSIARALVGEASAESVAPLLRRPFDLQTIRPTATRLLKETLSRGVVLELMRRGGWRSSRHLHDGVPVAGRVWERHKAPQLHFTEASFALCQWLTNTPLANAKIPALVVPSSLSIGDELLYYLGADLLVQASLQPLVRYAAFQRSRLVLLGFHPLLDDEQLKEIPFFRELLSGDGAIVLESLQWDLAGRWAAAERSRRRGLDCRAVMTRANALDWVLAGFLRECAAANRRDLADFVVEAGGRLLSSPIDAHGWLGQQDKTASLRDRGQARKAAGAFLRHLGTLREWAVQARHTAFFEDDYPAAQAFAARWELIGDTGSTRAEQILRELDSIDFETRQAS